MHNTMQCDIMRESDGAQDRGGQPAGAHPRESCLAIYGSLGSCGQRPNPVGSANPCVYRRDTQYVHLQTRYTVCVSTDEIHSMCIFVRDTQYVYLQTRYTICASIYEMHNMCNYARDAQYVAMRYDIMCESGGNRSTGILPRAPARCRALRRYDIM